MRDLKKLQGHHSFKEFMRAHNKDYSNFDEYQKRFGIFKENMQKVQFLRETERGTGKDIILNDIEVQCTLLFVKLEPYSVLGTYKITGA